MRTRYVALTAGKGKTATADINALINGAYQYTLPAMLPGQIREGEWELSVTAGTEEYAFPDYVIAPRPGIHRADDTLVEFWTNPGLFWHRYQRTGGSGPVDAILFYGRTATVRPVPTASDTIYIPAAMGPTSALSADGDEIADYNHAMCVVALAVIETCEEKELDELRQKMTARLERYMVPLRRTSLARARQRKQGRDF